MDELLTEVISDIIDDLEANGAEITLEAVKEILKGSDEIELESYSDEEVDYDIEEIIKLLD